MEIKWHNCPNTNCLTQTSHKLNKDGYFRKKIKGRATMYHRFIWEEVHGKIPSGYEINHLCKNRGCCNVEHLECITKEDHIIITNKERYKARLDSAHIFWGCNPDITGVELAKLFDVSFSAACGWIRGWRGNG